MPSCSEHRTHLPVLDGLRGLAALVVVISHCANAGFLPGELGRGFGQMGVALFYGLSGVLMGRLYLCKPLTRQSFADYAWRRGARVLPLYYAVLLFSAVLLVGFGISPYMQKDPVDVLQAAFLLQGTGVLWSIPVELHFYVLFIGLWYAATRGHLALAMAALLLLQVGLLALVLGNFDLGPGSRNVYTLLFWLHFFLVGTALGYLSTRPQVMQLAGRRGPAIRAFSVVLLACGLLSPPGLRSALGLPVTYPFADPVSGGYPLVLLAAGLFNLGALRVFAARGWRWLGRISYSVYLLHMPLIAAVGMLSLPPLVSALAVLAGSLALATITERWIEQSAQRAVLRRHGNLPIPAATRLG